MKLKKLSPIVIYVTIVVAVVVVGILISIYYKQNKNYGPIINNPIVNSPIINTPIVNSPVACTMEAKLCPDGSYVGRTGPNCEFSPCPGNNR